MVLAAEMLVLGIAVGLVSAALGVGGGIFMVPAFLELVEGMDYHTAKGTSLFIIVFVAAVNVWRLNRGHADWQWRLAGVIAAGSICGAWLGVTLAALVPETFLLWGFTGVVILTAARTFFLTTPQVSPERLQRRTGWALAIGLLTGLVSGVTGIGGGLVIVPLSLLAGIVTNARVVALSNMVMVVTCAAGALTALAATKTTELAWTVGQVDVALAPLVFVGAQCGAPAGKWLNARLSLKHRRLILGVLLALVALRLVVRALAASP
jgi:hypothetical protein